MSRPLPSLTPEQQVQVLAALSSLRLSAHDNFLLGSVVGFGSLQTTGH
jgi:hypothetical protein